MCTKLNIDFSKCGAMTKLNILQKNKIDAVGIRHTDYVAYKIK